PPHPWVHGAGRSDLVRASSYSHAPTGHLAPTPPRGSVLVPAVAPAWPANCSLRLDKPAPVMQFLRAKGWERMSSTNFAFLNAHDARLMVLGGLAERYFRTDPSTAIVKLRQMAELLA